MARQNSKGKLNPREHSPSYHTAESVTMFYLPNSTQELYQKRLWRQHWQNVHRGEENRDSYFLMWNTDHDFSAGTIRTRCKDDCQFYNGYHMHFSKFRISVNGKSLFHIFMFYVIAGLWNAQAYIFQHLNHSTYQIRAEEATRTAHGSSEEVLLFFLCLVNRMSFISHPLSFA